MASAGESQFLGLNVFEERGEGGREDEERLGGIAGIRGIRDSLNCGRHIGRAGEESLDISGRNWTVALLSYACPTIKAIASPWGREGRSGHARDWHLHLVDIGPEHGTRSEKLC